MLNYHNSGSSQNAGNQFTFSSKKSTCPNAACGKGNFHAITHISGIANTRGGGNCFNCGFIAPEKDSHSSHGTFTQQYSKPQSTQLVKDEKPKPDFLKDFKFVEKEVFTDENNIPLFEEHRFETFEAKFLRENGKPQKEFRQYKPNTQHSIGKETRRVPFNLPQLLKAVSLRKTVCIFEGARKVRVAEKLGFIATYNAGGSGGKDNWKPEFSEMLRGTDVLVFPDNDNTGKEHGERIVNSLLGIAASVKIVELPGLAEKGDIVDFINNGGTREDVLKAIQQAREISQGIQPEKEIPLFTHMTANEFLELAKNKPVPEMLFSEFWYQNEVCFLFASTNVGKTILAVQIGESIASGKPFSGFKMTAEPQKVLYFDFEMGSKQFQNRYSLNYIVNYEFSNNFIRVEINPKGNIPDRFKNFEEYLYYSLEQVIRETGAKVVIIDNVTFLKNGTETARDALPLIKYLKALKNRFELSLLLLAHTPKRDGTRPIEINDMQGSSAISNLCDSMFAIGRSAKDKNIRYIKQLKERETEKLYGSDNVIVCEIVKPNNFIHFEFKEFGEENHHLKQQTDDEREKRDFEALDMFREGKKNVDIAKHFGVSEGAVRKWKAKFSDSGALQNVPIVLNVPNVPSTNGTNGTNGTNLETIKKPQRSASIPTPETSLQLTEAELLAALPAQDSQIHRTQLSALLQKSRNILSASDTWPIINESIAAGIIQEFGAGYLKRPLQW